MCNEQTRREVSHQEMQVWIDKLLSQHPEGMIAPVIYESIIRQGLIPDDKVLTQGMIQEYFTKERICTNKYRRYGKFPYIWALNPRVAPTYWEMGSAVEQSVNQIVKTIRFKMEAISPLVDYMNREKLAEDLASEILKKRSHREVDVMCQYFTRYNKEIHEVHILSICVNKLTALVLNDFHDSSKPCNTELVKA